jgi:hypothetical protein
MLSRLIINPDAGFKVVMAKGKDREVCVSARFFLLVMHCWVRDLVTIAAYERTVTEVCVGTTECVTGTVATCALLLHAGVFGMPGEFADARAELSFTSSACDTSALAARTLPHAAM